MKRFFTITGKRLDVLEIDQEMQNKKHIRNKFPE